MTSKMALITEMKKELDYLKNILEVMKENEKLKKENERLTKQTSDLWELCSSNTDSQIRDLIMLRGEEYVKEVFAEDYHAYKFGPFTYVESDEEEFNEECEECGAKMSSTKLTEEEFDEHPDREAGYCTNGNWFCIKCILG